MGQSYANPNRSLIRQHLPAGISDLPGIIHLLSKPGRTQPDKEFIYSQIPGLVSSGYSIFSGGTRGFGSVFLGCASILLTKVVIPFFSLLGFLANQRDSCLIFFPV